MYMFRPNWWPPSGGVYKRCVTKPFEPIHKCKIVGYEMCGLIHTRILKFKVQKKFCAKFKWGRYALCTHCAVYHIHMSSVDVTWCCSTTGAVRMATSVVETYTCNRHPCVGTQWGTVVNVYSEVLLWTYTAKYCCEPKERGAVVNV